ncbi:MAG: bifunctional [glutamate--ammonia ligase]-adenylyl-L-tyrosine phosphorylase/[glutamate--ammonia-ligase] adenylyltransferase [Candidatus Ancaeobacter aquaticus]|nr:bifunctional [glutamate--ammonia ligase]-adenylyl-L-tyrosine phosphorylase/[glutamate--ammonia-ligase] adenylyltransferase [Candidatus Ancaeobacter aquaticus]
MPDKRIHLKDILNTDINSKKYADIISSYGFIDIDKVVTSVRNMVTDDAIYEYFSLIFPTLLDEFSRSPDPDTALNNFDRFINGSFSKIALFLTLSQKSDSVRILIKLLGTSQFLSDALIRNPEYFDWMTDKEVLSLVGDRTALISDIEESVLIFNDYDSRLNSLRRFKRREMLRIGVKDILGMSRVEETVKELSNIGDAVLTAAYRISHDVLYKKYGTPKETNSDNPERDASFAVISMGKLGGEELNYSSDIDVVFVYSEDGMTDVKDIPKAKSITNIEYFTKMGEMILSIIGSTTKEGYVFRIDTRLRPEGNTGPLVRSLESYQEYYAAWGEAWERMALIKARFSAGSEVLGKEFIGAIKPFVYQKSLSQSSIDEIKDIKRRIDHEVSKKGRTFTEVKLGYGGIREIEFTVQVFQLIGGGKNPKLQTPTTLNAIQVLSCADIFNKDDAINLMEAYRFLRVLEHFLQIENELQLHHLPTDNDELNKLAKKLGYADIEEKSAREQLMNDYKRHTDFVHSVHMRIFAKDNTDSNAEGIEYLYENKCSTDSEQYLKEIGFQDIKKAFSNIKFLSEGPGYVHIMPSTVRTFKQFLPDLMKFLKESPDPDMAFNNFERFVSSQGARSVFYKLLDENRNLIKLLVHLGAHSQYLSDTVVTNPDILGQILMPGMLELKKDTSILYKELTARTNMYKSYDDILDEMRRYKKAEIVRIGLKDILGISGLAGTLRDISALADASLKVAVDVALKILVEEYGYPETEIGNKKKASEYAIFGLGKLGGYEMGYSSDLDIVFVYRGDGQTASASKSITNREFFAYFAQKVIEIMTKTTVEGSLYKVDIKISPGGKGEGIVHAFEKYQNYYGTSSMTWERQAFTKARCICGDVSLQKDFEILIADYVYGKCLSSKEIKEIYDMRLLMQKERVKTRDKGYHIKLDPGGIVDIEFIVQVIQLMQGCKDKDVRKTNTLEILTILGEKEYLSGNDFMILHNAYIFMRIIENKIRIVSNHSLDAIPHEEKKLKVLIKRLGENYESIGSSKAFLDQYHVFASKVRAIFDNIFKEK